MINHLRAGQLHFTLCSVHCGESAYYENVDKCYIKCKQND